MRASEFVTEEWSAKYKRSINCSHPKGFSQRAHCAGRKKNEDLNEFSFGGDDDDTPKDDPYKYPKPEQYRRSIDFFGKFEANHFDKEDMDDATGVFKGYWYYGNKLRQIAYFKFNNPQRTGSNDPGMGWYYEPQDDDVAEGSLNEFAPGGNSASSYYAVTANFVNEFAQQKQEEIQDLIDAGWTKQDLAQAGTQEGYAADIAHFEQVRDGFLKGLKPGFDAYLQGDTQMKDQLGAYWIDNDLPLNQDWEKIYGEPWGDDGEFDEGVAEGSLNEFAPTNGNGKDYLRVLASAWLNDTFNTGDLHKGIKSQEDIERILERGVICADGKKRSYAIGYNHNFDGVILVSDDYYEYDDGGVDSRTNKPWGPYEYIEYSSDDLDESINEAAETDVAFEIDSEDAYNAVLDKFGSVIEWSGDYMVAPRKYWGAIQEVAYDNGGEATEAGDEQLDELSFLGSQCTKDCSGHRAGYEWSQRKGGADAASWSNSFNKGAWLHNNGH